MAIQISAFQSNTDIERRILCYGNLEDSCNWGQVCKLWQQITSSDDYLSIIGPFTKDERGIKEFLNKHAVKSISAVLERFQRHLSSLELHESYSFACLFAYNQDDLVFIKKEAHQFSSSDAITDHCIDQKNIDFCVLMSPLPQEQHIKHTSQGCDRPSGVLALNFNYHDADDLLIKKICHAIGDHDASILEGLYNHGLRAYEDLHPAPKLALRVGAIFGVSFGAVIVSSVLVLSIPVSITGAFCVGKFVFNKLSQ